MRIKWCGQGALRNFDIHEMVHCKPERPVYCDIQKKQLCQEVINGIMKQPINLHWRVIKNQEKQYSFAEVKSKVYGDASFYCGQLRYVQPVSEALIYLIFDNLLENDKDFYPYIRVIYLFR